MVQLLVLLASLLDPFTSKVSEKAIAYIGTPYRYGTASASGTDCSGLVQMIYKEVGIHLPRTAASQQLSTDRVEHADLQPGDLVFFANTYKRGVSHVGIYLGAGRFVHSATEGGVRIDSLSTPYYSRRLVGGGRPRRTIEPPLTPSTDVTYTFAQGTDIPPAETIAATNQQ